MKNQNVVQEEEIMERIVVTKVPRVQSIKTEENVINSDGENKKNQSVAVFFCRELQSPDYFLLSDSWRSDLALLRNLNPL